MTTKTAIAAARAAHRELLAARAQISAAREAAGVPDLQVWHAPFTLRDALAAAEAKRLAADATARMAEREAA